MRLSDEQAARFERDGWVFLPEVFGADEVALLRAEAGRVYASDRPEVVREKDGATARTAFAAHTFSEPFRRLAAHPRLIGPVEQLLGGRCYIHQFKINAKAAFDGDVWQWHQDYGTWSRDDLMPEPRAMNIALFLDEVTEFNGPLMFIPRQPQARGARGRPRRRDHELSAVDARPCDGARARRARRPGGAQGAGGVGADVPLQPGARLARQHLALRPLDRLRVLVRGDEPHPPVQAAGVDRAPRLHPDRAARRRLSAGAVRRRRSEGSGRDAGACPSDRHADAEQPYPRGARRARAAEGAVAGVLDDPQRQPSAREPRRRSRSAAIRRPAPRSRR